LFNINFKDRRAIYEQIKDNIKEPIISGVFADGDKLPSVRELSCSLAVNPNTVQRAYRELEAEEYIYTVAGKGVFASSVSDAGGKKTAELFETVEKAVTELCYLKEPKEELIDLINRIYKGE